MTQPTNKVTLRVGDDTLVVGRRNLWLAIFVVLLLITASMTGVLVSLRLVRAFESANAVHRARNEASHICITETIGEGRHRAQLQTDWSPKDATEFYESCVDRVAVTLVPPSSVRSPLRFRRAPAEPNATPRATRKRAAIEPVPARSTRIVYVPVSDTPNPTTRATSAPRSTPSPTKKPTPHPTPCDPVCLPNLP